MQQSHSEHTSNAHSITLLQITGTNSKEQSDFQRLQQCQLIRSYVDVLPGISHSRPCRQYFNAYLLALTCTLVFNFVPFLWHQQGTRPR